jgi:hypothetical protein
MLATAAQQPGWSGLLKVFGMDAMVVYSRSTGKLCRWAIGEVGGKKSPV